jgi:hypothetical protein
MNLRSHQLITLLLLGCVGAAGFAFGEHVQWGKAFQVKPTLPRALPPQENEAKLLADYQLLAANQTAETAFMPIQDRTLFVPSRTLAPPPAAVVPPAPTMRKGQFVLTGAIVAGEQRIAYLRELATNKTVSIKKGEAINGITVAEIEARKVVLKQYEENEELLLNVGLAAKYAPAPTPVPQPFPQVAAGQPAPFPGQPVPGQPIGQPAGFPQMPPGFNPQTGNFAPAAANAPQGIGAPPPLYPPPVGAAAAAGQPVPTGSPNPAPTGQPGQPAPDENPRSRRRMWQNAQ